MTDAKKSTTRWSFSTGERGRNRVRAFEHPKTGTLFLEFSEPTRSGARPQMKRVALGHRDPERAKGQAEELAAAIRKGEPPKREHVTLSYLITEYLKEVTPEKGANKQRHDRTAAELFMRAFGANREARTLSRREWDRFIRDRRSGVLAPKPPKRRKAAKATGKKPRQQRAPVKPKRRPVRNRIIAYDLEFLRGVLNWATMASDGKGGVLLERNPLKGLALPKEESPVRVRMDEETYRTLLAKAPEIDARFALALVLAHETGHRIGAIRMLRWSDVNVDDKTIRWRAENDKIGYEHVTPLTADALAALERERTRQCAIGDAWVFPAPGDPPPGKPPQPCSRHLFRDWWERGEALAELDPVKRRGWHALRRAFATELKHVPLKDLCELGGWKEPQTVLKCYMQADQDTMRAALDQRTRIAASGAR